MFEDSSDNAATESLGSGDTSAPEVTTLLTPESAEPGQGAGQGAGQSAAQNAGQAANETNAATPQDWTSALPESLREAAKNAGSLEAVQAALKHGLTHSPLSRVEDVAIEAPEGAALDEEGAQWFKQTAVKAGLSNSQVKALVDGYNAQAAALQEGLRQSAEAELRAEYGAGYETRMAQAGDACKRFNALTNGGLEPVLQSGLGNHPGFIRFMMAISDAVSDSSMPGNTQGGGSASSMSTEEFLRRNVFN